ncbi:MAG: flagellar protein FlgN [Betaproteobacteria bacterium]|nr:flagellar protein FlgN [Betaproteobacteria bacterium]
MTPALARIEAIEVSLGAFVSLLLREGECLARKDPDALSHVLDEKNRMTATLGRQWDELCQAAGLANASHDLLESRLVELGDRATLDAWRVLSRLSQRAKELNEQNGALIRLQLLHTNKAIEVLQNASRQNSTYGPDGLSDSHLAYTRTIDKA